MFVPALDPYYLSLTALITIGWQSLGFAIAFTLQIDTITDFWSALNFFALALVTLLFGDYFGARNVIASVAVMIWAVRLGGWQLFRLTKMGSDTRFDEMRSKFWSFAQFWIAQSLWVWTVAMPVVVLNSPSVSRIQDNYGGAHVAFGTAKDIVGLIFFILGFACEAAADLQKYRFKTVMKPPKGAITDVGVWHYSRRPNYFGEILLWLGIYLLCISPANSETISRRGHDALLGTVVSPLFTFLLLMFLSGVPLAEKPGQERYYLMSNGPSAQSQSQAQEEGQGLQPYRQQKESDPWSRMKAFRNRTSLLIPMPPALYEPLPKWIKMSLFFDLPMYNFDEEKDGPGALDKARRKAEEGA